MTQSALFEHRFWLHIMGDHARFIFNTLSSVEKQDIQIAAYYIQSFDRLLEQSRRGRSEAEVSLISNQAYEQTVEFRTFKLNLLQRALLGKIKMQKGSHAIYHS